MPNPSKLAAIVRDVLKHSDDMYTVTFVPGKKPPGLRQDSFCI